MDIFTNRVFLPKNLHDKEKSTKRKMLNAKITLSMSIF
ncbi:hypothetical protein HPCPY6081_1468 [Helicobacter pylori CPY6081]|nr:hypothetical protein HPCPY6081_1468 [Helicobacter pylori CPY6081]